MRRLLATWVCAGLLVGIIFLTPALTSFSDTGAQAHIPSSGMLAASRRWLFDPITLQWEPVGEAQTVHTQEAALCNVARNDGFPICTATGWQLQPAMALHAQRSEFLVVWEDARNGTDLDIYGQRFTGDGHLLGSNFALVIGEHDQCVPSVFYDPVGAGYFLLWHHRHENGYTILGQRLSSTGAPVGTPFHISPANGGQQWIPGAAYNPVTDQFLVVWEDMSTSDIVGQRITTRGDRIGELITVSTRPESQWAPPLVAFDIVLAEYLVVWDELAAGDIYGQIVTSGGDLLGEDVLVSTARGKRFVSCVVGSSTGEGYMVLWTDERALATHSSDVYGQRVGADGTLSGGETAISAGPGWQRDCVAAHDPAHNEYLLVWWDGRNECTASDIYGQRISVDGVLLGPNMPISVSDRNQVLPCLTYLETDERYRVVWQDWRNHTRQGDNADIYGLLYSPQRFFQRFPHVVQRWFAATFSPESSAR